MRHSNFIKSLTKIQDSDLQLRQHILWLIMIRVVLFTLLIATTAVVNFLGYNVILPPVSLTIAFLSVVFIYSTGCAGLLQNKTRYIRRFGLIQILSDTLFAALLVLGTGCSQSIYIAVFIFPIVAGGLILYRIGGLIPAALSTILLGVILSFEYFGYIPSFYLETSYIQHHQSLVFANIFAVYGITFFTIALLSGLLAGKLRTTEEELTRTSLEFDRLSQLYKQIFDDINTGIITISNDDSITSYNEAAAKITGFAAVEVIGQPFSLFFPSINVQSIDSARPVTDLQKKDGEAIRVGYSYARLNMPFDADSDDPACQDCKVITMQDISQVEKMEMQVRNAEKMAAVGELSAAIAHDFRNPLAAISGSAQVLAADLANQDTPDTIHQSLMEIIIRESDRMAKTITDFLQFARPTEKVEEWFDVSRLIQEIVEQNCQMNKQMQACNIEVDIPERLGCLADRQQMQTVLLHLLENSCLAAKQTDKPVVVKAREEEADGISILVIQIIDHGPGIDDAIRHKIFTPFFSTREDSTGLGLSIVKHLLENHNATIHFSSPDSGGCMTEIQIPLPPSSEEMPIDRSEATGVSASW